MKQKNMIKTTLAIGVYTVTCCNCGQLTIAHIDENGGVDPEQCRTCKASFIGIEKGQRHNEYLGEVQEDSLLETLVEEVKKTGNKSSRKKSSKKKTGKKSSDSIGTKKSSNDSAADD